MREAWETNYNDVLLASNKKLGCGLSIVSSGKVGLETLNKASSSSCHCYLPSFQRELSSGSHRSSGGSSGSKGKSSTNLKSKDRVLSGGSGECGLCSQQLG